MVPAEALCPECHSPMVLRQGPRGPFLACSAYPKCRAVRAVDAEGRPIDPPDTGVVCGLCGGPTAVRQGPRGPFLSCRRYPQCRWTQALKDGADGP